MKVGDKVRGKKVSITSVCGHAYKIFDSNYIRYVEELTENLIRLDGDADLYFYRRDFEVVIEDPIVKSVLKKYEQRSKVGIEKYGCTLERTDLTEEEWFEHLQEELFDATLYIERILKALRERK